MASDSSIAGTWAYQSYLNQADQPVFGAGTFTFAVSGNTLTGTLDMGGGFVLDLKGTVQPGDKDCPPTVAIDGYGRDGTPTAGWEYDYRAYLAYQWPNGVDQVPSLVGSIIRAKPHDGRPAGVTASFIAVKLT
jgi:hypothetical protein